MLSMQEEIFNRLLGKRMKEIQKISKEVHFINLIYYFKGPDIVPIDFTRFRGPLHIFKRIKNGNILLRKAEKENIQFRSELNKIWSMIK